MNFREQREERDRSWAAYQRACAQQQAVLFEKYPQAQTLLETCRDLKTEDILGIVREQIWLHKQNGYEILSLLSRMLLRRDGVKFLDDPIPPAPKSAWNEIVEFIRDLPDPPASQPEPRKAPVISISFNLEGPADAAAVVEALRALVSNLAETPPARPGPVNADAPRRGRPRKPDPEAEVAPAAPAAAEPEPETADEGEKSEPAPPKKIKAEEFQAEMVSANQVLGPQGVLAALQRHGFNKRSEVPDDKFGDVIASLHEAVAAAKAAKAGG